MSINKIFAIGVSLLVFIVVGVGFYLSGLPTEQRRFNFDSKRIQNLKAISYGVSSYAANNERLPDSLVLIVDGIRMSSLPFDPEHNTNYIYEATSDKTYNLCANFSRPSVEAAKDDFWYHTAGRQCFELSVSFSN